MGLWQIAWGLGDSSLSGFECEALKFDAVFLAHLDEFLDVSGFYGGIGADFDGDFFEVGADGAVELRFLAESGADLVSVSCSSPMKIKESSLRRLPF